MLVQLCGLGVLFFFLIRLYLVYAEVIGNMTWFILKLQTLMRCRGCEGKGDVCFVLGLRVQGCLQKVTDTAGFKLKKNSLI